MKRYTFISKHTLEQFLVFLFIFLFVYAAVSKLVDFETFQSQLRQSPLLGAYSEFVSWFIPGVELFISIFLLTKKYRLIGLYGFFSLMTLFTVYIVMILNFTDFIPCSCGGVLEDLGWTEHLVFNIFFISLSIVALLLKTKATLRKLLLLRLLLLITISILLLVSLFLLSEEEIKRNNAFQRRLPPHPISYAHSINLGYNSYYIAGVDDETIYLGNVTTPLKLLLVNRQNYQTTEQRVEIDQIKLPFTMTEVRVHPPYFYVYDGTIPIIFSGKTADWTAKTLLQNEAYFTQLKVVDSLSFAFRALSRSTKRHIIGRMEVINDDVLIDLNYDLIPTSQENIFESDGILVYNPDTDLLLYTYYYKNSYIAFKPDLSLVNTGRTIDTIRQPLIRVDSTPYGKQSLIKPSTTTVNINSASSGNRLYIQSDRLGRYEADEILEKASIIDVYEIDTQNYLYSFYVFDDRGASLDHFIVYKDVFIALMGNYLSIYKINQP